jgi:hypothetical protein
MIQATAVNTVVTVQKNDGVVESPALVQRTEEARQICVYMVDDDVSDEVSERETFKHERACKPKQMKHLDLTRVQRRRLQHIRRVAHH